MFILLQAKLDFEILSTSESDSQIKEITFLDEQSMSGKRLLFSGNVSVEAWRAHICDFNSKVATFQGRGKGNSPRSELVHSFRFI